MSAKKAPAKKVAKKKRGREFVYPPPPPPRPEKPTKGSDPGPRRVPPDQEQEDP